MLEQQTQHIGEKVPDTSEREGVIGKYDAQSMSVKFSTLSTGLKKALDDVLNRTGLSFEHCTSVEYLQSIEEDQLKAVSSLLADMRYQPDEDLIKKSADKVAQILSS
jgi:hypothetical protein